MDDLDARELAQLGLKHIEDAIVGLLSRHADGLAEAEVSARLGLGGGPLGERRTISTAVLALLVDSGRILWDGRAQVYRDNPRKI